MVDYYLLKHPEIQLRVQQRILGAIPNDLHPHPPVAHLFHPHERAPRPPTSLPIPFSLETDPPRLDSLLVQTQHELVPIPVPSDLPDHGRPPAKPNMGDSNIISWSTGSPGELGRVPLEHLPLGVHVRVHRVVVDANRGDELLSRAPKAADQRGFLVREVDAIVELEVGVGI